MIFKKPSILKYSELSQTCKNKYVGTGIVVQQVMLRLVCQYPIQSAGSNPSATLPIQLLAVVSLRTVDDRPGAWDPATHVGDLVRAPGFKLAQP